MIIDEMMMIWMVMSDDGMDHIDDHEYCCFVFVLLFHFKIFSERILRHQISSTNDEQLCQPAQ